jgi:hypothetical protein
MKKLNDQKKIEIPSKNKTFFQPAARHCGDMTDRFDERSKVLNPK